uniref:ORF18 n=1 Tax=Physarum polycephalum TaxID=5791 RepID=Q9MJ64_PHYPO|nr:hypothetical protein PhpooMp19 [Physarum polycephalum]BAB08098.1 unnamed protein product [Physarum polycephalum]
MQNFIFDMSSPPFNMKVDGRLIINELIKNARQLKNPEKKYLFSVYILVSGKRANVLPSEAKILISDALDELNDSKLAKIGDKKYTILKRVLKRFESIRTRLSKVLNGSEFSDTIANDTGHVKKSIMNLILRSKDQKPFTSFNINILTIAKRIKDYVINDNDILMNTDKDKLAQAIESAKLIDLSKPKKSKNKIDPSKAVVNTTSKKKNKRGSTPASIAKAVASDNNPINNI